MLGRYTRRCSDLSETDLSRPMAPVRTVSRRPSGSPAQARPSWLRTPPDLASPPRDELVIKVLVSLRVPGTDVGEVIQAHRRYLVELMQQWTRIKESGAPDD